MTNKKKKRVTELSLSTNLYIDACFLDNRQVFMMIGTRLYKQLSLPKTMIVGVFSL